MADQPPKKAGASRLLRIALVASLALNLAIAGLFIGSAASGRLKSGPPPNFEIGLGPIGRVLSSEERREIRRNLLRDGSMRELNLRGRMDQMIAAMQADPYDPEIIRALMADQIAKSTALQSNAQDALLQVISDMTPERRAAFADALKEDMSRERPPRDKPSGG